MVGQTKIISKPLTFNIFKETKNLFMIDSYKTFWTKIIRHFEITLSKMTKGLSTQIKWLVKLNLRNGCNLNLNTICFLAFNI